jgi:hypothetical protein
MFLMTPESDMSPQSLNSFQFSSRCLSVNALAGLPLHHVHALGCDRRDRFDSPRLQDAPTPAGFGQLVRRALDAVMLALKLGAKKAATQEGA